MKRLPNSWLLASLLTAVLLPLAPAQNARIEIKGSGYQKSISAAPPSSPTPDRPSAEDSTNANILMRGHQRPQIHVVKAEFGHEPFEAALPAEKTTGDGSEGAYIYATEYDSNANTASDRKFRSAPLGFRMGSGAFRSSDIQYGLTGGARNSLQYGSGRQRSDIRYGLTEGSRNGIQYGSGTQRSDIRYGLTGGARNDIRYGSESQ